MNVGQCSSRTVQCSLGSAMTESEIAYTVYYVGRAQFGPLSPLKMEEFWPHHSEFARAFIMSDSILVAGDANDPDQLRKDLEITGHEIRQQLGPIVATGYVTCGVLLNFRLSDEEAKAGSAERFKRSRDLQALVRKLIPKPTLIFDD